MRVRMWVRTSKIDFKNTIHGCHFLQNLNKSRNLTNPGKVREKSENLKGISGKIKPSDIRIQVDHLIALCSELHKKSLNFK